MHNLRAPIALFGQSVAEPVKVRAAHSLQNVFSDPNIKYCRPLLERVEDQ
jgi:hypothetical protein